MLKLLKEAFRIREFTSIIKVTKHGVKRLIERGFTPEDVTVLVKEPTYIRFQTDGAKVYVKEIKPGRFNILVLNELKEEVVTALKSVDPQDVDKLRQNYGWHS